MTKSLPLLVGLLAIASAAAQTPAQLKQDLRQKESAAAKDPDQMFEVGKWAEAQGLAAEAKRLFQAVLKLDPTHKAANEALGNELVDGKWMTSKDAAAARKKLLEAEYRAKGMVEVGGVWVEKDQVADAKKGIYFHEREIVSKEEKMALMSGMVRHPETGELIEPKHLEKAQAKLFPIGTEGRWASEAEADRYHADPGRPWIVRSGHCTLVSTLPLAKLQEVKQFADRGVERLQPILGYSNTRPSLRPTILIAATTEEYNTYGTRFGDETSAYGAFLADQRVQMRLPYQGDVRPAVCHWEKSWGPYYLRHAAGMGYLAGLCAVAGVDSPLWFLQGCGSYASRFENDHDAGWYGKQHLAKGGVKDLKGWFNSFAINGEMEPTARDFNIYQAGLMISFAAHGGDDKATQAMQEITAAFAEGKGKAIEKGIDKLRSLLIGKEDEIRNHLQVLISRFRG